MKIRFAIVLIGVAAVITGRAEDSSPFKDDKDKASYAVGMNIGTSIKRTRLEVNPDLIAEGIKDMISGKETKLTEQQARETLTAYQREGARRLLEKNRKEGEAFLAENKKKEGVKTHSVTAPDGTRAEMQYKVLAEGAGPSPGASDTVTVNYRGTLINGTEFDSSSKRNQPAQMALGDVIPGWTAALQLMKVGSKWQLFIPPSLAYGDRGTPMIEPETTLIFEVELLSIEPAKPVAAAAEPQALTSDIIRVPSAEESKAGAKPEIIKAKDLEQQKTGATNGPPKN
jgi:FKBP-type peptidyl-prolyl cis-trans isomerase FklB